MIEAGWPRVISKREMPTSATRTQGPRVVLAELEQWPLVGSSQME